uniref:DUF424 family protein n=1 Tax=Heterorhabditis bacteriophora TaxID=37862 RepID=A0A1I7W803_HETBA
MVMVYVFNRGDVEVRQDVAIECGIHPILNFSKLSLEKLGV